MAGNLMTTSPLFSNQVANGDFYSPAFDVGGCDRFAVLLTAKYGQGQGANGTALIEASDDGANFFSLGVTTSLSSASPDESVYHMTVPTVFFRYIRVSYTHTSGESTISGKVVCIQDR